MGGILRILQSDWLIVFSYLPTTGMVTNHAKRRVKLRIERAKFQNMTKTELQKKNSFTWKLT